MVITDTLKRYMKDINEFDLITTEREKELAKEIKKGNVDALNELVQANLRFVIAIAIDYSRKYNVSLEDLVSDGNVGLIHAAGKYDADRGAKFSTYASWWIKQAMRRTVAENNRLIRIPTSTLRKIRQINKTRIGLTKKLGYIPSNEEISDESEYSLNCVERLKDAEVKVCSIHAPIYSSEHKEIHELILDDNAEQPDQVLSTNELFKHILHILPILKEREQRIIIMRFGLDGNLPQTLDEIGTALGRTRERIRQLEVRSLKKLRRMLNDEMYAKKNIKLHGIKIPQ